MLALTSSDETWGAARRRRKPGVLGGRLPTPPRLPDPEQEVE